MARLTAPKLTLEQLEGLVIIDEFQQRPDLLPLLRVLLDRQPLPARFLLLGSASPDIVRGASESLAGRIEFVHMSGCKLTDAPRITRSMRRAAEDLQLDHLYVVYPGDLQFALDEGVTAMPLTRLPQIDGP